MLDALEKEANRLLKDKSRIEKTTLVPCLYQRVAPYGCRKRLLGRVKKLEIYIEDLQGYASYI
jgi:hypothetical protein